MIYIAFYDEIAKGHDQLYPFQQVIESLPLPVLYSNHHKRMINFDTNYTTYQYSRRWIIVYDLFQVLTKSSYSPWLQWIQLQLTFGPPSLPAIATSEHLIFCTPWYTRVYIAASGHWTPPCHIACVLKMLFHRVRRSSQCQRISLFPMRIVYF